MLNGADDERAEPPDRAVHVVSVFAHEIPGDAAGPTYVTGLEKPRRGTGVLDKRAYLLLIFTFYCICCDITYGTCGVYHHDGV